MILTITKGAHRRNVHLPELDDSTQFAHQWDPSDPEDVPHQVMNFLTYANALGVRSLPHVLLSAPVDPDPEVEKYNRVQMQGFVSNLSTATHSPVVVR